MHGRSCRLFLSALDTTSVVTLGLKGTQLIALVGIAVGLWLVVSRHNRPEPVPAPVPGASSRRTASRLPLR